MYVIRKDYRCFDFKWMAFLDLHESLPQFVNNLPGCKYLLSVEGHNSEKECTTSNPAPPIVHKADYPFGLLGFALLNPTYS